MENKIVDFVKYLEESVKDKQKEVENKTLQANDASHGEKAENISEADKQKEVENKTLQAKDASHGEKAETIKEEDDETDDEALKESLLEALSGLDNKFIEANKDRAVGEKALSATGQQTPFVILVNNDKNLFIIHKKGTSIGAITYDKINDTKAEVILNKEALTILK